MRTGTFVFRPSPRFLSALWQNKAVYFGFSVLAGHIIENIPRLQVRQLG